jgi:ABC-2 type transport system permease protein
VLIGILVFFFVFIVAGISFLQERTSGTLEKLLSTPIRRWEIVAGYTLGYGAVTVLQSILVSLFVVYVLGVILVGSLWLVLLVTLLAAISALTLGILLSTAANNEFQMMQFIPVVITHQIFLSGLFELSPFWTGVGKLTPVYYVAHALNEVMIRGSGFSVIWIDLLALTGYCALFMAINVLLLRKHRAI